MDRRSFIKNAGLVGVLLSARPLFVLGEEKKYTHVADMYPWEGIALDEKTLYATPGSYDWVIPIKPAVWKEQYTKNTQIRELFSEPNKMDRILELITDGNFTNDELSNVGLTKSHVVYWLKTDDPSFTKLISKYDGKFYYKVFVEAKDKNLLRRLYKCFEP